MLATQLYVMAQCETYDADFQLLLILLYYFFLKNHFMRSLQDSSCHLGLVELKAL